jgi:hypothetical protein
VTRASLVTCLRVPSHCCLRVQAVLRAIYGYFMAAPQEDIPRLEMPLHTLIGAPASQLPHTAPTGCVWLLDGNPSSHAPMQLCDLGMLPWLCITSMLSCCSAELSPRPDGTMEVTHIPLQVASPSMSLEPPGHSKMEPHAGHHVRTLSANTGLMGTSPIQVGAGCVVCCC